MKHKKMNNLYLSNGWRSVVGVIICSAMIIGSAALIGLLLIYEIVDIPLAFIIGKVMLLVCSMLATLSVIATGQRSYLTICVLITVSVLISLLIYSAFSNEGVTGSTLINCVLVILGGASALTIRLKMNVKANRRKKAYR